MQVESKLFNNSSRKNDLYLRLPVIFLKSGGLSAGNKVIITEDDASINIKIKKNQRVSKVKKEGSND